MPIRKYWKSILWMGLILFACSIPSSEVSKMPFIKIPHFDKLVHFAFFFVLTVLLISETIKTRDENRRINTFYLSGVVAFSYGLIVELLQHLVFTSRSGSFLDILANLFGILAAVLVYNKMRRFLGYLA